MDSRDQSQGAVRKVLDVLRKVTRMVQLVPFVYLAFYAIYMIASAFSPEGIIFISDGFLTTSPFVTTCMLFLSRLLKLCRWHKTACLIPSFSQIENVVDSYVFTFTQNEIIILNISIGVASALFLYLANKHFFHDGRKGHSLRDARLLQVQG